MTRVSVLVSARLNMSNAGASSPEKTNSSTDSASAMARYAAKTITADTADFAQ